MDDQGEDPVDLAVIMGALDYRRRLEIIKISIEIALNKGNKHGPENGAYFDVEAARSALKYVYSKGTPLQTEATHIIAALMQDVIIRVLSYPVTPDTAYGPRYEKRIGALGDPARRRTIRVDTLYDPEPTDPQAVPEEPVCK